MSIIARVFGLDSCIRFLLPHDCAESMLPFFYNTDTDSLATGILQCACLSLSPSASYVQAPQRRMRLLASAAPRKPPFSRQARSPKRQLFINLRPPLRRVATA